MDKKYVCVCGMEFMSSQAFNGHKAHCKTHQFKKYGNLDVLLDTKQRRIKSLIKNSQWRRDKRLKEQKINDDLYLITWISEQHKCEKCGKIMTERYGSGRFCSSSCSHSRTHTRETKMKISKSVSHARNLDSNDFEDKFCAICGKSLKRHNKSGYCIDCLRYAPELKGYRSDKGKYASSFVKKHVTWLPRNKLSYPEKFWVTVLNNNNIQYKHNYMVPIDDSHRYFLDFYIQKNDVKIDLEIDGKQHKYDDRIIHDIKRDESLKMKDYVIYRIDWNEINSQKGKDSMRVKINNFLSFYNRLF